MIGISRTGFLLVVLSAVLTAIGNLLIRKGVLAVGGLAGGGSIVRSVLGLAAHPAFDIGFLLYGIAALVWFRVLGSEQITTSYPMLVGCTFLLVSIGAVLIFRESISSLKLVGMVMIIAGIVVVSRT